MDNPLFHGVTPPDPALLFRRNDPNDPRLGEVVKIAPEDYATAHTILLGCPQDEGVRRNQGRIGAAAAPDAIRAALYKLPVSVLDTAGFFDLGNTRIQDSLEATHTQHQQLVERIIADGKRLIVLGGGNDISFPDAAGLAAQVDSVLAFNIDAHFDVRADEPRNSGTPYRQLLEGGHLLPDNFYEMGFQWFGNAAPYIAYLREKGVQHHALDDLRMNGIPQTFADILQHKVTEAIFWGFDMDVVRAADAPGVSAPNPTGMTGAELCQLAQLAGRDPRTRLVEISEVNPTYDLDGRTCRLAAVAIFYVLLGITQQSERNPNP